MKTTLLSILIFLSPIILNAQFLEGGFFIGATNYSGDLSEVDITISETNMAIGSFIRYNINDFIAINGRLYHGKVSGNDLNARYPGQSARGLHFRAPVTEVSLSQEINIFGYDGYNRIFTPYVYFGIAAFHYDPQRLENGRWVRLQPLGLEQGMSGSIVTYNLISVAIPMGFGIKGALTEYVTLGAEYGIRKTFTDYIDDVSYRGNSSTDDWYHFGGVTISYNFQNGVQHAIKYGCPVF